MSQSRAMKAFEWIVYAISGLFSGYDDSGTTQSTVRTINASHKAVHGTDIFVDAKAELTIVEHPIVKIVARTTRMLGSAVASIANVVTSKNRQDEYKTDRETFEITQHSRRVSRFNRFLSMLDQGGKKEFIVTPDMEELNKVKHAITNKDFDEEALIVELNCLYLRFIIAQYRVNRNKISSYDAHKLRTVLLSITEDDAAVRTRFHEFMLADAQEIKNRQNTAEKNLVDALETAMRRRLNISLKKSKGRKFVEKLQRVGDGFFSGTTGMSVVSNFASTLLSVPVVNIVIAGVMIGCGAVAATARLLREFLFDKQHRRLRKKNDNLATRGVHTEQLESLYNHVFKLNDRPDLAAPRYCPVQQDVAGANIAANTEDPHVAHKAQFAATVTGRAVSAAALSIVVGWFMIDTIIKVVTGFGGAALAVGSQAALAVPIVGVIVAGALFLSKTALDIYRANKEEQKIVADLNARKQTLRDNIKSDPDLHTAAKLSDGALLRQYIQSYLEMKDDPRAENKEVFMKRIENLIGFNRPIVNNDKDYDSGSRLFGFSRGTAKTDDDFYSYLAGKLSEPEPGQPSREELARQVKVQITDNNAGNIIATEQKVTNTWKQRIFRKKADEPTKHDHKGNFRRLLTFFKDTAMLVFGTLGPIGIGFGVAFVVASGPYFPIVAAAMAATLITAFLVSKVIEYKRDQRKEGYNQELTKISMQDKTAEYAKLRVERANEAAVAPAPAPEQQLEAVVAAPAPQPENAEVAPDLADNLIMANRRHSFVATGLAANSDLPEPPLNDALLANYN